MTSSRVLVALAIASLSLSPPAGADDGLKLFHRMQKALGGADTIAAVRDFEQQVRAESWNGSTGQSLGEVVKRTRWVRPDLLRVDQVGPGSTYVLFFDGTSGWEIIPGTQKVVDVVGDELAFAREYSRDFKLNMWLADRDPRFKITSPAPRVVRLSTGKEAEQIDITLDAASFLPVKISKMTLSDPAHPVPGDELIEEWDTVQGVHCPRRFTVLRRGARVAEVVEARTIVNGGLTPADLKAQPPDFKPVLAPAAH